MLMLSISKSLFASDLILLYCTFKQPHLERTKLCDMKDGELDQAYVTKRDQLKQLVTSIIRPKIVQGRPLNGKEFVTFLEQVPVYHTAGWFELVIYYNGRIVKLYM